MDDMLLNGSADPLAPAPAAVVPDPAEPAVDVQIKQEEVELTPISKARRELEEAERNK